MSSDEGRGSFPAAWALSALAAAALWLGAMRPFPLDDDWAGLLSVGHLLREGRLVIPDIVSPTFVWHVLWGGAFSRLLGAGPASLRLSTLALSALALWAYSRLCLQRAHGASPPMTPAFLLLSSPFFFLLSFTFMTDVPFLAWMLLCLWAVSRALESRRLRWWLLAGAFAAACYLVRQLGLAVCAGAATALLLRRRLGAREAAAFLGRPSRPRWRTGCGSISRTGPPGPRPPIFPPGRYATSPIPSPSSGMCISAAPRLPSICR